MIKGPFVHKKAQENFERKTHKRVIKVYDAEQGVMDKWVAYLAHHALAGVGVRVVRWHRAPIGVGEKTNEYFKSEMRGFAAESVKKLAAEIVEEEEKAAEAAEAARAKAERKALWEKEEAEREAAEQKS